jgi:hypothetical protein
MSRGAFGLVSLLVAAALVAGLWAMNASKNGPASPRGQQVEQQAAQVAAAANFTQAAMQLEAYHAQSGTYAGATLSASGGVALVRADASSFCLQSGAGAAAQHLAGPGGQPAGGPC